MVIDLLKLLILLLQSRKAFECKVLYPPSENIGKLKPLKLSPSGSICGLEIKDTLCDNRLPENMCSNRSSVFFCDQTCPYGNVLENLNALEQLKLENMNPCTISQDFNSILFNKSSQYSYYFDKTNNLCNKNNRAGIWRTFSLEATLSKPVLSFYNSRTSSLSILNSGFTFSLWFKQANLNNGTLLQMFRDNDQTILNITINSSLKKIYLSYFCNNTNNKAKLEVLCILEMGTNNLVSDEANYLALKIYKNTIEIFVNEPKLVSERVKLNSVLLEYDLGSYIVNNYKVINYYIGNGFSDNLKYYGWIQEVKLFLIALTNIEIADLNGRFSSSSIKIQPECRCPNEFPQNENENSTFCIDNKIKSLSYISKQKRLNENAHPLGFLNDDDYKTSWISCILTITNSIILEIDLQNGIYIIERIEIFFASLPPTNLAIERLFKNRWITLQSYSTECNSISCVKLPTQFSSENLGSYTIVWSKSIEDVNVLFSNETLKEDLKASKLRFIMNGYYSNIKNDIRQLYYAINELKVKGRCDCNGYSSNCDMREIPFKCECEKESNTGGSMCNECKPLFNNQMYQSRYFNSTSSCSECNCNNRSDLCTYDTRQKTGVCLNCKQNTDGINCQTCRKDYYFDMFTNRCEKCHCNLDGVEATNNTQSICNQKTGQCICKKNIIGFGCGKCKDGYFNFSRENLLGCMKCDCFANATVSLDSGLSICDEFTGQCQCKSEFVKGVRCDACVESMYNLQSGCNMQCSCDPFGSLGASCNQFTGQCVCKPKLSGLKCDMCEVGFYNLTRFGCLNKCSCDPFGSINQTTCDSKTGQCLCKQGYSGRSCDTCMSGFRKTIFGCVKCECNLNGIKDLNNICDLNTGKCICNDFTEGFACDICKPAQRNGAVSNLEIGYWSMTNSSNSMCTRCECDPIGTSMSTFKNGNYVCDPLTSQCTCNKNRIGMRCETCATGFFFLNLSNIDCLECNCDPIGSIPGSNCNSLTGECSCKVANGIGGTSCDQCLAGFYNFSRSTGACFNCFCNEAGSLDQVCDQYSGQCNCKQFVTGSKCNTCVQGSSNLDIENPFGCSKSPSKQSPPTFNLTKSNLISLNWSPPDYPNGIIRYYLVYRNETIVFNTTSLKFEDKSVMPFTIYAYRIQSHNDEGNATSRAAIISINEPIQPCCRFNYRILNIRSTQIEVVWTAPERLNGLNLFYFINVYRKKDPFSNDILGLIKENVPSSVLKHNELVMQNKQKLTNTNFFQVRISNLEPYTLYFLEIQACNRDLSNTSLFYCLKGEAYESNAANKNMIRFFTSQDKPENQPAPVIFLQNSSFVVIGIPRPLRPNGIILLYEVWLRTITTSANMINSLNERQLACAIEDLYDPYDFNATLINNQMQSGIDDDGAKLKNCKISNLNSNSEYAVSATSSNIIGRSKSSEELKFITLENKPTCAPHIAFIGSFKSDSIYFSWQPSLFQSQTDVNWKNCIGGNLKNFTIYLLASQETNLETNETSDIWQPIYIGLQTSFSYTKLSASTVYMFRLELCNGVGCISTEVIQITTLDPPPNSWIDTLPTLSFLNASALQVDWSNYRPLNTSTSNEDSNRNVTYRVERAEISFAFPPVPLESGIRFHGLNYFKFNAEQYFPEGYPYFGLKYSYKSRTNSSLVYFAGSSFAQSELTLIQLIKGNTWFVSNTQSSKSDTCSSYLSAKKTGADMQYHIDSNRWHTLRAFRLKNYFYMRVDNQTTQSTLTSCESNQVITDVSGVFLGGLPPNYLHNRESADKDSASYDYQTVQSRNFQGCLKNLSTIVEIDDPNFLSSNTSNQLTRLVDFDFLNDAESSAGEPAKSNTINGCPLDLDSESSMIYLMGFGFFFINARQSMPLQFQTNSFLIIDFNFRTEFSQGLLFFNYDLDNDQFIFVRLLDMNILQVNFKCRVRYEDPKANDLRFTNFFDLYFNETFYLADLNNGYWNNININFDLNNRTFFLNFNYTRIAYQALIKKENLPPNLVKILDFNLRFTFYLSVQFFLGGFEEDKILPTIDMLTQSWIPAQTFEYFMPLFRLLETWSTSDKLSFTGCIKNIKINSFQIDLNNLNNIILYKHVRFDGCPPVKNICNRNESSRRFATSRIESIYEGSLSVAYDKSFKAFTEYFYRIVAFNTQGKSYSPWILLRTPDSAPTDYVDHTWLKVEAISGYKIMVINFSQYCYYCSISNRNTSIFTGIVDRFVLRVSKFNKSLDDYIYDTSHTFYCEQACYKATTDMSANVNSIRIENLFSESGVNIDELYIDTTPISNYSLSVGICTRGGCSYSEPLFLVTLGEVPDGIYVPELLSRTSDSLYLGWQEPNNPSGDITAYILRMNENIIYFGLRKEFWIRSLKPLSNQSFSLEVCNSIGCARSELVYFQTTEMAPLSVPTPLIVNITQTRIFLKWNKPDNDQIINGLLIGYILYVNNERTMYTNEQPVVFNITGCLECSANIKELDKLMPGTQYIIVLSACTHGGCTNSSELKVNTIESIPLVDDILIYTLNKSANSLVIEWSKPKYPNGQANKYILFMNDKQIYEGLSTNFSIYKLSPNTFLKFYVIFCNNYGCSQSKSFRLNTDEDVPGGSLILEAKSAGSNQIELNWYAKPNEPLITNGQVIFSANFYGQFLLDFNLSTDALDFIKQNKPFTKVFTLNLLNTTVFNTKYGILDRLLPNSEYTIQINASNTKGYLLSNKVTVKTLTAAPDVLIPPQLVSTTFCSIKLEWYEPILLNSDDHILFYQVEYKIKYLWNSSGFIKNPVYERKIFRIFSEKTSTTIYTLTGLRPYTAYMFQLTVFNSLGEAKSEWTTDFLTNEHLPSFQDRPNIIEFGSNYTVIEWHQPQISNGIIIEFQILVYKCQLGLDLHEQASELVATIKLNQDDYKTKWENNIRYNVTQLESFAYYVYAISGCNSVGCATSSLSKNITNEVTLTRTKPSLPENFEDPTLESSNSYSVEIKWKLPKKPNGIISYFILERFDYSLPLSFYNQNNSINNENTSKKPPAKVLTLSKKYRFDSNKFRFVDYDSLTSCGTYSYRMQVFNQIAYAQTNWRNATVRASKPLIVSAPIIYLIDSNTARFEWIRPLTLCEIESYKLILESVSLLHKHSFNIEIKKNLTESIVVKKFIAYTIYKVKLVSCVYDEYLEDEKNGGDLNQNSCTESLSKQFQTSGKQPEGFQTPRTRLVSPRAVSIEWLEPVFRNGETLKYQLVRQQIMNNKTEAIYLGTSLYYLDLNVINNHTYRYKVIFTNEFGSSMSNWSSEIKIESSFEMENNGADNGSFISFINSDATQVKLRLNFNLDLACISASSVSIKWRAYKLNELLNLIVNSYERLIAGVNDYSKKKPAEVYEGDMILSFSMAININNLYDQLLVNDSASYDKLVPRLVVHNLIASKVYSFFIRLRIVLERVGVRRRFELVSEIRNCSTRSIEELFGPKLMELNTINKSTLSIKYTLIESLVENYQNFRIYLNKTLLGRNISSEFVSVKQLYNVSSVIRFSNLSVNTIYSVSILACAASLDINRNGQNSQMLFLFYPSLFMQANCIQSQSELYALSTQSPSNLSTLTLYSSNYSIIEIKWQQPLQPNDFRLNYLIYRRESCPFSNRIVNLNNQLNSSLNCDTKNLSLDSSLYDTKVVSCMGVIYERRDSFACCGTNYIKRVSNSSQVCCGGKFYKSNPNFQCCASLYYVHVPPDQICCYALNENHEIRFTIGHGNKCCADFPYFDQDDKTTEKTSNSIAQYCCNGHIVPKKYSNSDFELNATLQERQIVYEPNGCFVNVTSELQSAICTEFKLIQNQTNSLTHIDTGLRAFKPYDYKLCVQNTFSTVCTDDFYSRQTQATQPFNFTHFRYEILCDDTVALFWNYPLHINGVMQYFKLFKDEKEIHRSLNLTYIDMNGLRAYELYKYEIEACNQVGCVKNKKTALSISTKEKKPELFGITGVSRTHESVSLTWKLPLKPNGLIQKFVLIVKEICLEVPIYFDFDSNLTKINISINELKLPIKSMFFAEQSLHSKYEDYNVVISGLRPYSTYSLNVYVCNGAGCIQSSHRGIHNAISNATSGYIQVTTLDYRLEGFQKPIIYIIDHRTVDIVWQEPEEINGNLVEFKVYRNNELLGVLDMTQDLNASSSLFSYKLGFFAFRDAKLSAGSFYSYKIQASNEHFSLLTRAVIAQMPPTTFLIDCGGSKTKNKAYSNQSASEAGVDTDSSLLSLFDGVLDMKFAVASASQVKIAYDFSEWQRFILCLSKSSYSNSILNKSALDVVSVFSIKILLQSNINGLQSLDFPYPSKDDTDLVFKKVQFMLSGLMPYSNYSIRISFSALYPKIQVLTTGPIFLRTWEQAPCCLFKSPLVIRNVFSQYMTIKWSTAHFNTNGFISNFTIIRYQLKENGCVKFDFDLLRNSSFLDLSEQVSNKFEISLNLKNANKSRFFFDETHDEFVYIDSDSVLANNFSFFIYKIVAYNVAGKLESEWSQPIVSWQFRPSSPPYDLRIVSAHSTGFRLKFKQPARFNGLLSYYTVKLVPFAKKTSKENSKEVVLQIEAKQICQEETTSSLLDVHVSGLESFQSYKISVRAVNQIGVHSEESEEIVGNTLESSPEYLQPLNGKSIECFDTKICISFKFVDPGSLNGQLLNINLYQIVNDSYSMRTKPMSNSFEQMSENVKIFYDNELKLIYSGLQRDFLFTNLFPYKMYSFIYELCTFAGCARQIHPLNVRTIEIPPMNQPEPIVRRIVTTTNEMFCFQIGWRMPEIPNGKISGFEIYRMFKPFDDLNETIFGYQNLNQSHLIKKINFSDSEKSNYTTLDCDLLENYLYTYQVISRNRRGSAASNFSKPKLSKQVVPNGFDMKTSLVQFNATVIRLDWYRPKHCYSTIMLYNVYRDSKLIHTRTVLNGMSKVNSRLTYYDFHSFLPKTVYKYEVFACNEAGCSTDPKTYFRTILTRDQGPLQVIAPILFRKDAHSAFIDAANSVQLRSNETQRVVEYRFYMNQSLILKNKNSFLDLHNLEPHTVYSIKVEACTFLSNDARGCLVSFDSLDFCTNQSAPEGLAPVKCVDIPYNEYHLNVNVTWQMPRKANGILRFVKLKRNGLEIFSTNYLNNRMFNAYFDTQLEYGKNYSYELSYFNDASFVSSTKWHVTMENMPQLMLEPKCGSKRLTELVLVWSDPLYANGMITKYIVKHKHVLSGVWQSISLGTDNRDRESIVHVPSETLRSLKIENIIPFGIYEFQVTACNRVGCVDSSIINDRNCSSLNHLPEGLINPDVSEMLNVDPGRIDIYISWRPPLNSVIPVLSYIVSRTIIQLSIAFNPNYQSIDEKYLLSTSEIHKSLNFSFIDSNLRGYSTYDYFVEVVNSFGSRLTPIKRIRTRPLMPAGLSKLGNLISVSNESAKLDLRPPFFMNGELQNVTVLLKRPKDIYSKEIRVFSLQSNRKNAIINGLQLLQFLRIVTLDNLEPNQNYEVKTRFCNQIGCLRSVDFLEFQTLDNDRLIYFNATKLKSNSFELIWGFKFGNRYSDRKIKYEVKYLNAYFGLTLYEGENDHFYFHNAKPYTTYRFEIVAISKDDKAEIMDTKTLNVLTLPESPKFKEHPTVNILMYENQTILLDINWQNSVNLNDELKLFELNLNNRTIYVGKSTNLVHTLNTSLFECILDRTSNYSRTYKGGYFLIDLEIKVKTAKYSLTSPILVIPFNCTVEASDFSNFKTSAQIHPWIFMFLFGVGLAIILFVVLSIAFCMAKCKQDSTDIKSSSFTTMIKSDSIDINDLSHTNSNFNTFDKRLIDGVTTDYYAKKEIEQLEDAFKNVVGKKSGYAHNMNTFEYLSKLDFDKSHILRLILELNNSNLELATATSTIQPDGSERICIRSCDIDENTYM